ncbi:DUF3558 domain-containing protein [Nocardia higoensis]|uniref:DUF3558 domain-containing protein n=1 Tax=Nocardia higoensis TaxID=228599 RepID=A0ABS0DA90_9NOCA|nr:DUF3558 family protein [Nocardia higoensis]MBF6353653.1 DUF3558 domain-containing protein [Nocardia higoensis]
MVASLGIILTVISGACADPSNLGRGSGVEPSFLRAPFNLCDDVTADFYAKYGFDYPPRPSRAAFVVGPNKGSGCSFNADRLYSLTVAMTDDPVGLGVASEYNKLVYENYVIGDMPAEIARAQSKSSARGSYIGSASCEINVELPDRMVTFYFSNSGFLQDAPEPCDKLTEIATDVVMMIQSKR